MSFFICNSSSAIIASCYSEAVKAAQTLANDSGLACKMYRIPLLAEKVIRPLKVEEAEAPKPTKKAKRK